MTGDYFFFYAEANIVCIAMFLMLLYHDRLYGTRQETRIWFDRTVTVHIPYFLSDIGWAAVLGGRIPRTRLPVILFNFLNYLLLALIAYGWFMYMASSENMPLRKSRKQLNLIRLPLYISFAAILVAYTAAPEFWVSPEGELNTLYYPMMLAAPLFYILAAFIVSMVNAKRARSRNTRRLYYLIGLYPLCVVFFGLLQLIWLNVPLFCFGCTTMMLFFYLQSMQSQVSLDSLTRLNNRGQISRYMEQVRYRDNVRVYAAMLDIDRFKSINDTYGHAEGDRALVILADALRYVAEHMKTPAFIGRYGGDEFTIIAQAVPGEDPMPEASAMLSEQLALRQAENRLPFDLTFTLGYDFLQGPEDTMEACLVRADENLYQIKRESGKLRGGR